MTSVTITPQQVQQLREKTGAGLMDCKRALESSNSDLEKAIQLLREKGKASAAQKAGRRAAQGVISSWISADAKKGGLVELNCETDFVARTAEFLECSKKLAQQAAEHSLKSVESLCSALFPGSQETVDSVLKEKIARLGENILLKKAAYLGGDDSVVGHYIHAPFENSPECGTLGVLLALHVRPEGSVPEGKIERDGAEIKSLLKELSMQIAAAAPKWIGKENVPSDLLEKERAIYHEQCRQSGKPEKAWDKIIQGKLADFYKQFCLLEQAYIREPKTSVQTLINQTIQKHGGKISIQNFVRFKVGEE